MKLAPVLLLLVSLTAFGQELRGRIERIDTGLIQVHNGIRSLNVYVDDRTTVIGRRTLRSLSRGEEIRVLFDLQPSGKMVARRILTSITVSGVVNEVYPDHFLLLTNPDRSAMMIWLHPSTVFGASKELLQVDQEVHVVGWDEGDGAIAATRVAFYGSDVPVQDGRR